jgi:hypothetical protein
MKCIVKPDIIDKRVHALASLIADRFKIMK